MTPAGKGESDETCPATLARGASAVLLSSYGAMS
jgi:hypothetical protein